MSLDAVILTEINRRTNPIGSMQFYHEAGASIFGPDGSEWLRTGLAKAAASYPVAAQLEHIKVTGLQATVASMAATQIATDGAGRFVIAFGDGNNVKVSTDGGATWNNVAHNCSWPVSAVAYGGGVFVAVAAYGGNLLYSSQTAASVGSAWTVRGSTAAPSVTAGSARVYYGGGKFVAFGTGTSAMAYSSNGTSWTAGTLSASIASGAIGAAWTGTKWLMSGSGGTAGNQSTDGVTWTAWTAPASTCNSMAYGAGKLIFSAASSGLYSSSDGGATFAQLTSLSASTHLRPNNITHDGTRFIAGVSGYSACWWSTNGTDWVLRNVSLSITSGVLVCGDGARTVMADTTANTKVAYTVNFSAADYVGVSNLIIPAANATVGTATPSNNSAIGYVRIK